VFELIGEIRFANLGLEMHAQLDTHSFMGIYSALSTTWLRRRLGVRSAKKSSTFEHLDVTSLLTFGRHFRVANSERYASSDRCLNVSLPEPDAARKSRV
jgi:hypothetical protein